MASITVFNDVIVSQRVLASGIRGKQIRQNRRIAQVSGYEQINIEWDQTLREYEVGFIPMLRSAWSEIETLHEITDGGAYGMLLEDPKDVTVSTGVAVAITSTTFQLQKKYTHAASSRTKLRKITRPRASGFVVKVSGSPLSGGSYTLNSDTGVITIPSAPSASNITWTGKIYVPVHFAMDVIDWTMLRPGSDPDERLIAGPSVVLKEIRE